MSIKIYSTLQHAILLSSLLASSHTLLKWVSIQEHDNYFKVLQNHWFAVGLALSVYGFIFFYYIYVLKNASLSSLYPVYTGLSIILVLISAKIFFNESFTLLQVCGALFIVFGISLVLTK